MSKNLKETIDRLVEDSIRRILPGVMNEVLLKTIANSGVVQERHSPQPRQAAPQPARQQKRTNRPSSLGDLLDETAGADFYDDPRASMTEALREEVPTPRSSNAIAQRIQSLPPELQGLAEGISLDDDGGEMWGDDEHDAAAPTAEGPPLERAAKAIGLDFSRMKKAASVVESKKKVDANDRAANAQFEQQRINRMRERLNEGKPIE